jgi:hypothetical protein
VDKTIHKLIQRGRKGNCHEKTLARSQILSRSGLRWFHDRLRFQVFLLF